MIEAAIRTEDEIVACRLEKLCSKVSSANDIAAFISLHYVPVYRPF